MTADSGDALWDVWRVSFLEALDGTSFDLTADSLLDDMIVAADAHPKIMQLLTNLPGYPNDPGKAVAELEFLAGMATANAVISHSKRGV